MEIFVAAIAGLIVAGAVYLLFILLFLVRLLHNRFLYSRALRFMRPVLRELYAGDLAAAADAVLAGQPDAIHLAPEPAPAWKYPEQAGQLRAGLKELGFAEAGAFSVKELPGVKLLFHLDPGTGACACVAEHPLAGAWLDFVFMYPGEKGLTVSSLKDPGLPPRMRRPGCTTMYFPGADAAALYDRFMAARLPGAPLPFSPGNVAARFEESWALDMDWRKQNQFTPEEALAIRKGKALPPAEVKRSRLFDVGGGVLAVLNLAALIFFLFASRAYAPVGNGPWAEALWYAAVPAAVMGLLFAFSVQASGPVMRSMAAVFMGLISLPFFWGTLYTGGIWANGALDAGPSEVHRAPVTGKREAGRRGRSRSYYVSVRSWRPGREEEELNIGGAQYQKVIPGRTVAVVAARRGRLGHEWRAGLGFEDPAGIGPEAP